MKAIVPIDGMRFERCGRAGVVEGGVNMLAELSIEPLGKSDHVSAPIARVIDLIAESGLDYQVTAMGTLVEGDSQRVWDLVRRCHDLAREGCGRVITQIRIDERSNGGPALHRSVERVEKVLGKPVHKSA